MKTRLVLIFSAASLAVNSGCRAVVHVNSNAPNSTVYLLDRAPAGKSVPPAYLHRAKLPASFPVKQYKEPHWVVVTAPDHSPNTMALPELSRKRDNSFTVKLERSSKELGLE